MQSVTLGVNNATENFTSAGSASRTRPDMSWGFPSSSSNTGFGTDFGMDASKVDPAQLQHLAHLLSAAQQTGSSNMGIPRQAGSPVPNSSSSAVAAMAKQTAVVECPKSMVGRVIGKGGDTIKSLQQYTGAMIQIDQSTDPTRVTIAGSPQSLQLAVSMVNDIVKGTFKGFAMLRQIAMSTSGSGVSPFGAQPHPVYIQGYGFVPPSQVFNPEQDVMASSLLPGGSNVSAPSGPLTPPITPLRGTESNINAMGGFPDTGLASLLAAGKQQNAPFHLQQHQQQQISGQNYFMPNVGPGPNNAASPVQHVQKDSQDALIAALLSRLAVQQQPHVESGTVNVSGPMPYGPQHNLGANTDGQQGLFGSFLSQGLQQRAESNTMSQLSPSAALLNSNNLANQQARASSSPLSPNSNPINGSPIVNRFTGAHQGNVDQNKESPNDLTSPLGSSGLVTSRESSPIGRIGNIETNPAASSEMLSGEELTRSLWHDL